MKRHKAGSPAQAFTIFLTGSGLLIGLFSLLTLYAQVQ